MNTNENTWPEFYNPQKSIKLVNGETLICRFGKYEPGLCFVLSDETVAEKWMDSFIDLNINFDAFNISWMIGEFWISRKGSSCFRPTSNGHHVLIRASWGGSFEPSRGNEYTEVKKDALYARQSASHGGGCGYNYYVFPKDFKKEVTIDDI